jgi:hypothetical protein
MQKKIAILLGSKLQFGSIFSNLNITHSRFGTSVRKDLKREDWPGPGGTDVPSYTKGSKTNHNKK